MTMNSLIADTIARINNAQKAGHDFVIVKSSKMVKSLMKVLQEEGYIQSFEEFAQKPGINLVKVDLKYVRDNRKEPVISYMKIISKPGCRVFSGVTHLPKASNGLGTVIISTSHGLMANHMAIEKHVGGEIVCEVY